MPSPLSLWLLLLVEQYSGVHLRVSQDKGRTYIRPILPMLADAWHYEEDDWPGEDQ